MTGKTHMAISAATVAILLAAGGARAGASAGASIGMPHLVPIEPGAAQPGASTIAGLLFLGIVAGLFPDLDAPDTELQHLPTRAAKHLGRYLSAGMPRHPKRSPLRTLMQEAVRLAALPFGLMLAATGAVLRTFTGHRGFTHTLWGALTFTGLAAAAAFLIMGSAQWSLTVGAVWLVGYASHLAADACTPSGIPLFGSAGNAPSSRRGPASHTRSLPARSHASTFHLLPKSNLIRTGTMVDRLVIRWAAWAICAGALTFMIMVRV